MKKAYIFRGPPASGKNTILKPFVRSLSNPAALLELDVFRWDFHFWNLRVEDITEEYHHFAYHNFLRMVEEYARFGKFDLVLEGLFSWNIPSSQGAVSEILPLLQRNGYSVTSILLTAEKETLWYRNQRREYVVPRAEFDLLYRHVMETVDPSEVVIDSTDQKIDQMIEIVQARLL
jgi:hypothetical protein